MAFFNKRIGKRASAALSNMIESQYVFNTEFNRKKTTACETMMRHNTFGLLYKKILYTKPVKKVVSV